MDCLKKFISSILVVGLIFSLQINMPVYAIEDDSVVENITDHDEKVEDDGPLIDNEENKDDEVDNEDTTDKEDIKYEYKIKEDENGNFNIVRESNIEGDTELVIQKDIGHWTSLDGIDEYSIPFSNLIVLDDELFYNTPSQIRKIDLKSVESEINDQAVLTVDIGNGFIFGIQYDEENGKIQYIVKKDRKEEGEYKDFIELQDAHIDDFNMNVGDEKTISIQTIPENATKQKMTFKSDNEDIVTVDEKGVVKALTDGEANITVKIGADIEKVVKVTVHRVLLEAVEIPEDMTLFLDDNDQKLTFIYDPEDATIDHVKWVVEDENIATIDEEGVITPHHVGETIVKAIVSDGVSEQESNEMKLVILPLDYEDITVNDLKLNVNQTKNLNVIGHPVDVKNKNISYQSEDNTIATVDSQGNVKGIKAGTVKVLVTYTKQDGTVLEKEVNVTVNKIAVSEIKLNKTSLNLELNKTSTLTATITPNNATNKTVSWKSSNKNIVTVSDKGVIQAKKIGTAMITATADGKSVKCNVTVIPQVTLSKTSTTLNINQTYTLKVTPKYSGGVSSQKTTYSSSKTAVATVSSAGKITGKKAGTATITVKVSCKVGSKTYTTTKTCKVTVKSVTVTSVKLNRKSASIVYGSSLQLKATVNPTNASNKKVTWSSSNKAVATVSSTGKVTSKKVGTATITVKSANGKKATCKITVTRKNISGAKVSYQTTYTYTGRTIRPSVSVKIGTKTLKKGTDYTVSYGTNKKTKGTIKITGKGNYTGSLTKTFTIKEKKETMSAPSLSSIKGGFKVSYKRGNGASGYQIAYSTSRSSGFKTVSTRSLSKTISGLKSNKTYYVKVRFYKTQNGKTVYSQYSSTRSVKTK